MAKPELGTKRLCPNCGTKYYDLNRDPIRCPKCGTLFTVAAVVSRAKAAPAVEEEPEADETAPIEFVPLEEAEADESADDAVPGIEDEEIADIPDDEDDTFLEAEEDDEIDGIDIDVAGEDEER